MARLHATHFWGPAELGSSLAQPTTVAVFASPGSGVRQACCHARHACAVNVAAVRRWALMRRTSGHTKGPRLGQLDMPQEVQLLILEKQGQLVHHTSPFNPGMDL